MRCAKFSISSIEPIRIVEWVIAVFTLIGGVYLFTPLYRASVATSGLGNLAMALSHPSMIFIWALLLSLGAALVIVGLVKDAPSLKGIGWFSIGLARTFQLLTTFLTVGFLPITWIYLTTITVIVFYLWALAKNEIRTRVRT